MNHPTPSRAWLLLLFALPLPLEAAVNCQKTRSETLRQLDEFLEERSAIEKACKHNRLAPANNRTATLSGTCERTYKFMNGYVLQVRALLKDACARVERAQNADCRPGQAECLRSTAMHFDAAAAELEKAEKLLKDSQKKMSEQRGLNADVGKMYGRNLEKIRKTIEQQKSALNQPSSDISGADAVKTEGLSSLREVIKAYELPEDPKIIGARAHRIERAFGDKEYFETPEYLGPFAGEQFTAYRKAGEFSRAAGTLGSDLHTTTLALQLNAEQTRNAADLLQNGTSNETGPASIPTGPAPAGQGRRAAPSPRGGAGHASDLQLSKAAGMLNAASALAASGSELARELRANAEADAQSKAALASAHTGSEANSLVSVTPLASQTFATSAPAALPLSGNNLVVWYEPRNESTTRAPAAFVPGPGYSPAGATVGALPDLTLSSLYSPQAEPDEPIPTLDPDEPVIPQSAPGLRPEREYSLRDQLRRQLAAEEKARSNSTLATAKDPDAAVGEQDMRYDRRLGGLTPLAAFTMDEQETAATLLELTEAFQKDIEKEESVPLFVRVHQAHERFVEKTLLRTLVSN